jgi:Rps23 Pro-64 3,4-dihydroxylase Tpa1-like proline 4-hydroxylase
MFHSIYGNDIFHEAKNLNVKREQIKNIIGERAEEIVFKFNNTPRLELLKLNDQNIKDILVANQLDNERLFKIYDLIFDNKTIDKLYGAFRDHKSWYFTGHGLNDNHRKFSIVLKKNNTINKILFDQAEKIMESENLKKFTKLERSYASGYTHGTIHDLHTDDGSTEYNKVFTIMFYLNKHWDVTYGGETVFVNHDKSITSILPQPGRAILFDGFIPHLARDPSRICTELRMVATFKYGVGK